VIGDEISFTMNYISYNYCNLNRAEYSGTDITSTSDDVLSEAGTIQIINLDWGPVPHFCPLEALQPVWLMPEAYCTIPVF
jgi:hypothetical protein